MANPEINESGEITLEGHLIGSIQGFRFTLARSEGEDAKGLNAAAQQVVAPEISRRADRLAGAPNEEFVLSTDGTLRWRGEVVASLAEGDSVYAPRLIILADEALSGPDLERVQDRLNLWLRHHINTVLEPVLALEAPTDIEGAARGIAYRLYENLGLLPRSMVAEEVKALDQDVRGKLRKLGVKFGAYHIYVPLALKPAPRELALILYALKNGGVRQPGVTELPHTVLSGRTSFHIDPEISHRLYEIAGFKVAGKRAVRIDILERLADIIRPLIAIDAKTHQGQIPNGAAEGNGFRVTVEMTSLLGTSGEDFNSVLTSLGYRVRRTPKIAAAPAEAIPEATPTAETIAPPVETEAQMEAAAEAPVNAEATAVVEGTAPEAAAEAAAVETAAADLGAPAPGAAPEEPQFDEVWFPGGRRPDNARHEGKPRRNFNKPPRDANAAPADGAAPNGDKPPRRFERKNKPEGDGQPAHANGNGGFKDKARKFEGKPKFNKRDRDDSWKEHRPREKRDVPLDPNSPWAALAALRTPKPE
jgi:ATP-dependent RNA helicase SUPV3L1/SUV3